MRLSSDPLRRLVVRVQSAGITEDEEVFILEKISCQFHIGDDPVEKDWDKNSEFPDIIPVEIEKTWELWLFIKLVRRRINIKGVDKILVSKRKLPVKWNFFSKNQNLKKTNF